MITQLNWEAVGTYRRPEWGAVRPRRPGDRCGLSCTATCAQAAVSRAQPAFDYGACIADLADAAGHINPNVTRAVYRHQISDTVTRAPAALDQALAAVGEQA